MNALTVHNLTKTYSTGVVALKGISFEIAEGDFFALLGQNGAGKSTTIGIVCSLVNKTGGDVKIFGHDLSTEEAKAKSLIGLVPQEMNFNVFEKVSHILINQAGYYGIPKPMAEKRMEQYLTKMGLWEMRNLPAFRLSGGMKRRLLITRALMSNPKLLILDEPTAGVDIELRRILWEFLTELNTQGTTIILTTHYLEEAEKLCKNVAIIDHGEIIVNTKMKSLINRLNVQTFILDTTHAFQTIEHLEAFDFKKLDDYSFEVTLKPKQTVNDVIKLLDDQHITITSMRNKINRLEELFIRLTSEKKLNGE